MRYTRLFNAIGKLALARFSIAVTMGITREGLALPLVVMMLNGSFRCSGKVFRKVENSQTFLKDKVF